MARMRKWMLTRRTLVLAIVALLTCFGAAIVAFCQAQQSPKLPPTPITEAPTLTATATFTREVTPTLTPVSPTLTATHAPTLAPTNTRTLTSVPASPTATAEPIATTISGRNTLPTTGGLVYKRVRFLIALGLLFMFLAVCLYGSTSGRKRR